MNETVDTAALRALEDGYRDSVRECRDRPRFVKAVFGDEPTGGAWNIGNALFDQHVRRIVEREVAEARAALADAERAGAVKVLREAADALAWVRPETCPCEHPEACCGSEQSCDLMSPSTKVIGESTLRAWADELERGAR